MFKVWNCRLLKLNSNSIKSCKFSTGLEKNFLNSSQIQTSLFFTPKYSLWIRPAVNNSGNEKRSRDFFFGFSQMGRTFSSINQPAKSSFFSTLFAFLFGIITASGIGYYIYQDDKV